MEKIISYKNYIHWRKKTEEDSMQGDTYIFPPIGYDLSPKEIIQSFKGFHKKCKYCSFSLEKVFNSVQDNIEYDNEGERYGKLETTSVYECTNCKWWYLSKGSELLNGEDDFIDKDDIVEGIIEKYNVEDSSIPITELRKFLHKFPEKTFNITPKNFEKLVLSIYKDFYDCEIKHIGGPGDNGIDGFAIINETPHIIQAKRRTSSLAIESVSVVREFVGTLITENYNKGHIITSAKRFSQPAIRMTQNENLARFNIEIKLKALPDIIEMLKLTNDNLVEPWKMVNLDEQNSLSQKGCLTYFHFEGSNNGYLDNEGIWHGPDPYEF